MRYSQGFKETILKKVLPPENRLEALKHDLSGYHSIRINDQQAVDIYNAEKKSNTNLPRLYR